MTHCGWLMNIIIINIIIIIMTIIYYTIIKTKTTNLAVM